MLHLLVKWPSSYPTRAPGLGQMIPEQPQSTAVPSDTSLPGSLALGRNTRKTNLGEKWVSDLHARGSWSLREAHLYHTRVPSAQSGVPGQFVLQIHRFLV